MWCDAERMSRALLVVAPVIALVITLSAHAAAQPQPQPTTDAARASEDAAIARSLEPSFLEATNGWIAQVSAELARPLTLASHGELSHTSWGPWVMRLEVSDGTSSVSMLLHADRSRSAWGSPSDWSSMFFVSHLRAAFALRMAAAWLADHPSVTVLERRTVGGGTTATRMRDETGTILCVDAIHPHEAQIAGCWREPGEVSEIDPEAFDHHRRGDRVTLRGQYRARVGAREITIAISVAGDGRITRREGRRPARQVEPATPTLGPLEHLEARLDGRTLVLASELESITCVRTDVWTCEAVRPLTAR